MYRCVACNNECPASDCTSRSDPPTVDILRAAFVMKVRRPECDEHPTNPRSVYQRWIRFTIARADVRSLSSVVTTYGVGVLTDQCGLETRPDLLTDNIASNPAGCAPGAIRGQ